MPKLIKNVQENILCEGKKVLIKKGYDKLNIREICKNCNIATGTFYNYFSSKEDLARQIFISDWNKSIKVIDKIKTSPKSLKEKLRALYIELDKFISNYMSTFYELSMRKGKRNCKSHSKVYSEIEKFIDYEKERGTINSTISSKQIAEFIVHNFVCLSNTHYLTFDEFYSILNI
ncbi:TetR/AcrR family transcriptional regulator [Clostridium niameyense]|uniref:TetR/AcrR family transcriptional regulator n=1 Tax=Clostridium niameyense TaxID=1622073 RepID=UPI00067F3D8F|nr:TetR/AcrR family transcriptional regulator [Clostridium niameyense]